MQTDALPPPHNPPPPVNFVSGSELFVVVSTATVVSSSPASEDRDTVESGSRWNPWAHTHPLDSMPSGLPPPLRPSLQYSMPRVMRRARWLRPPPRCLSCDTSQTRSLVWELPFLPLVYPLVFLFLSNNEGAHAPRQSLRPVSPHCLFMFLGRDAAGLVALYL